MPDFKVQAFHKGEFKDITREDILGTGLYFSFCEREVRSFVIYIFKFFYIDARQYIDVDLSSRDA